MFVSSVPKLPKKPLSPYERITNVSSRPTEPGAQKILDKGWRAANGFLFSVEVDKIDWWNQDQKLRSVVCALHSWNMMDVLLAAYTQSKEIKFLRPCIEVAYEWAVLHKKSSSISEFSWYDMAVGLRTYRLAFIIDAAVSEGLLKGKKLRTLWDSLKDHLKNLSPDQNISFHNNHGYFQIAGQLLAGRRFHDVDPLFKEAYLKGNERLLKIIDHQFTQEGVHKEHSPEYHYLIYTNLRRLIDTGVIINKRLSDKVLNCEKNLSWFVYPNGLLVNFGDSPSRDMRFTIDDARSRWLSDEMRYITTEGSIGTPLNQDSICFASSGYWIVRKSVYAKAKFDSNASYLALNAAFHSRTHKHADDLSFVWFEKGRTILVDSGRYGYYGKTERNSSLWREGYWYSDPNRIYCESTRAHNTLEFDDMDFKRIGRKPYGSAIEAHGEKFGVFYCKSSCVHFDSIKVERLLIFKPGEWLWVLDRFHDVRGEAHKVNQWFNFSPECSVTRHGDMLKVNAEDNGGNAECLSVSSLELSEKDFEVVTGISNPRLVGWYSPVDSELIPSAALKFIKSSSNRGAFATLFSLTEECSIVTHESYCDSIDSSSTLVWNAGESYNKISLNWDDLDSLVLCSVVD